MKHAALFISFCLSLPAQAGIDFVVEFEAGSKWFTESWSEDAREEMVAFLDDVGALFDTEATARVRITDDATSAYASAGSAWNEWYADPATGGLVRAPGLWMIVVQGVGKASADTDVNINWNLDVDSLYGGNPSSLIHNIRGLGRHEMHHAFGSSSSLFIGSNFDSRGRSTTASLIDTLYRDSEGQPLLGAFNSTTSRYVVNNFEVADDWATARNQSGLYFEARDRQGRVIEMPPISGNGFIDFSHITGIAYVSDHPTWRTYVDTDFNFLRALGYPLLLDSALLQQPAGVSEFKVVENEAVLTFETVVDCHYRLAFSSDLHRWSVLPVGKPGTGSQLGFTHPIDTASQPHGFFQVVEISE